MSRACEEHRDIFKLICQACKQKWWHYGCVCCVEPWKSCQECCDRISKSSSDWSSSSSTIIDVCRVQMFETKNKIQQDWIQRANGIVSYFLTQISKNVFPTVIVNHLVSFLDAKDGFSLSRAVLASIFNGFHAMNFNPFEEPFFSQSIMTYFHLHYTTFETQIEQLLRFDRRYLFRLFEVTNFKRVFPKLINKLPEHLKKLVKDMLPIEFLQHCETNYQTKYKKCQADIYKRVDLFNIFLIFFKLHLRLRNRDQLMEWKARKTDLTSQDIKDFVKAQKIMFYFAIQKQKNEFQENTNAHDRQRCDSQKLNELKFEERNERNKMSRLGRLY
jgi:hypothetical protein